MNIIKQFILSRKENKASNDGQSLKNSTLGQGGGAPFASSVSNFFGGTSQSQKIFYQYYNTVSPVATSIDMIANALVDVPLRMRKVKDNEFDEDADPLLRLKKPNCLETYREFIKELGTNFLIAGNTFIKLTGDINKPPLEVFNIASTNVTLVIGGDGLVSEYQVSATVGSISYKRLNELNSNNCLRYVTDDHKSELVHIKDFSNAFDRDSQIYGVSKMRAICSEIEQLIKANVFNYSTLVRSGNLSIAVSTKSPISEENFEKLKSEVHNKWGGAERAGGIATFNGSDIEIQKLSNSQRDMDYRNLKDDLTKIVYSRYGIPLPLVSDKVMTFNNLATSNLILYDNAVIPLANTIFDAFTLHILPRYPKFKDGFKFDLNKRDITALETRQNERVKILSEVGVLTQNELRGELGFEKIDSGNALPLNAIKAVKYFTRDDVDYGDMKTKVSPYDD